MINVVIYTDTSLGAQTDDIEYCTNYRTAAKAIIAHVKKPPASPWRLYAVISRDLSALPGRKGRRNSRVEKPGAVRFSKSVGVEIVRRKKDAAA